MLKSPPPLLADLAGISRRQREALVTLLGGSAVNRRAQGWVVPEMGTTWAIHDNTLRSLARDGLVAIGATRAKLTTRGRWYARTAAYREADERAEREDV